MRELEKIKKERAAQKEKEVMTSMFRIPEYNWLIWIYRSKNAPPKKNNNEKWILLEEIRSSIPKIST